MYLLVLYFFFFFFNDTATTEIYTLSLHDALPISFPCACQRDDVIRDLARRAIGCDHNDARDSPHRSEEHTSELQSHVNLVCRLLLEKKKCKKTYLYPTKNKNKNNKKNR